MADPVRPEPRPSLSARLGRLLGAVSVARLATGTGAVLLLAVTAWWLLRSPAPPVERSLPSARATVRPGFQTGSTARPSGAAASSVSSVGVRSSGAGPPPSPGLSESAEEPTTTAVAELVVQAAGAVLHPGVYRVPTGARVADVVSAAGGPAGDADLQAVALAAKVTDGARVYVPRQGEAPPPDTGGSAPSSARSTVTSPTPEAPLDLNAASVDELDELPGVGPATAKAIVDYRNEHGSFSSVDDLLAVRGIGPAKLDGFRDLVRVG
jgi:competence protein ComEA